MLDSGGLIRRDKLRPDQQDPGCRTIAESIKLYDSRDVYFIVLTGQRKDMGPRSKGLPLLG